MKEFIGADERLSQQLSFLAEIDKMKGILRQTMLTDKTRRENDAEHSWHFATMAMILHEYMQVPADIGHVLRLALVHDLVEIYAGDTFAYDAAGYTDKTERELAAADKIFGLLPEDQGEEIRALWEEFEAEQTNEARYAAAIDRFQPFLNNYLTDGHTWKLGMVRKKQVYARMAMVQEMLPRLWPFVETVIDDAVQKGYIKEEN